MTWRLIEIVCLEEKPELIRWKKKTAKLRNLGNESVEVGWNIFLNFKG